jgi:Trypsin-like peptidase domain
MIRRLAITIGVTVVGLVVSVAPAAAATPKAGAAAQAVGAATPTIQVAPSLASTIALSNCSGALIRYPTSVDSDRALMLTNGHCYEGGMPGAGVVLVNLNSNRSGTLLNSSGARLGTVRADRLLYATMTNTDVSLYRLTRTFGYIKSHFGATALTISATHPVDGSSMFIPSSYWKRIWNCSINGFAATLREYVWTWHDSIRYSAGCTVIPGTSGSPIVDVNTGNVVGINNTSNENGEMCTLDNPCEVDPDGTTHAYLNQSYGQEVYWFTTCLDANRNLVLTISGCLLPSP